MKGSEEANSYTIDINKKKYTFYCTDGEQHVLKLQKKLTEIIDALAEQEPGHILSNYAMKIALLLADEIVREETCRWKQEKEIDETIKPLIYELDTVLNGKF
ncbi:MAG: cell division protein ZapA [Deltaproteobacteria bacterium]|jgi:cell division protein ZapA (FtsZ GTPase activity inhibitor)|nr:cell division protein ZapA [Deltaproteobacteria bacterium]MBT4267753.1 cell division protein ZapA [Deltaproteobacteria bacterium]MBT4638512.1 cell division protein ZapA [Deltaproteobacteria bacterium]MBT6501599.1 cell division protein ZapA [Deltaproteobacteria bacterium]MBT6615705.1 cell division protein ZapA [Deltaproteobacteria bacterium]